MRLTDLDEWRLVLSASAKDPDAQLAAASSLLRGAEGTGERSLVLLALDRLLELHCRRGDFDGAARVVQKLSNIEHGPESALTAFTISKYPELAAESLELAVAAVRSAPSEPGLCRQVRHATALACRRTLWLATNGDQRRALDILSGLYTPNIQFLPGVAALIEAGAVTRARGRGSWLARAAWRSSDVAPSVLSTASWRRFRGPCACGVRPSAGPLEDGSSFEANDGALLRDRAGAMVTARLVHLRVLARGQAPQRQSQRSILELDELFEALEPCLPIVSQTLAALAISDDAFQRVAIEALRSAQWERTMCRPRCHQAEATLSQLRALASGTGVH